MAKKNRSIYSVDEDLLKRVVAGDTSALGEIRETESDMVDASAGVSPLPEKREGAAPVPRGAGTGKGREAKDAYRKRFLSERLTGTRRQTYIHDSLYRMIAGMLPALAPDMTVPTFVNNVLSDHLRRYEGLINDIYEEETSKKPVQWKE